MNVQELIDALNEQWEKKIVNIKAEIKTCITEEGKNGLLSRERVLEIIDKHIGG